MAEQRPDANDPDLEKEATQDEAPRLELFSVFTVNQKRAMVATGSLASFFSPLSSSIYFPALDTIAGALNVSTSKIDLTVTTYLIMQGVAPTLIAGFSDTAGRRPAYIICFTIYIAANLGLGLQNNYGALLGLRCLQSAGSSGTVALANGLVGDLVTSAERGTYIAYASLGSMLGPSLSPIIGGLLSQYLNWHWLFWFLLIYSGAFFIPLLLFLPETCRKVVADGSVPPPLFNQSVSDVIRHRNRKAKGKVVEEDKVAEVRKNYAFRIPSPMPTLRVVVDLETAFILLATGVTFACFYAVMTGATTSFHNVYHLNNIQTGLMYIPIGAGGIASAFTTGRLMDWNYRRHATRVGMPVIRNVRQDLTNFNIERVRLEIGLPMFYTCLASMIAYGWVLGHKVNLAVPVILLFISGWSLNGTSQVLNAMMVDLWPGRSAAATAASNLFRCELGAAASAAITPMSEAMGQGWAYTTLGLISVAVSPTMWVVMGKGIEWRQRRLRREQERMAQS
ncbi:MFS general substrate transporter [Aspergillus sclerotioniger CBS 115572]|uniref:MFS general substrate transporter n=1 Tax=Aspergillus sclerotioniger CBS 115572 TaxID=1450535 RepID=A0A317WBM5_9EURO|nr:MFS general substrate transporter [Aspergillus sclerotioniger CBS 115572]PWY81530.1 MFS general substrate transporter [Aspergillus sclerotioniger CBS 115572]